MGIKNLGEKVMKKKLLYLITLCFLLIGLNIQGEGKKINIYFEKGSEWFHDIKVFLFTIKGSPQIAVWIEDGDGKFLETLYVSSKTAKWVKEGKQDRSDSLSVWSSRVKGSYDTVTGATVSEKGSVYRKSAFSSKVVVFAEVNNSFDYNEFYTKKNSGVNGQPSLIYSAEVDFSNKKTYNLKLVGCGSVGKSDPLINRDLSKITTAKEIIKKVMVKSE